jgi:hypothetical protein
MELLYSGMHAPALCAGGARRRVCHCEKTEVSSALLAHACTRAGVAGRRATTREISTLAPPPHPHPPSLAPLQSQTYHVEPLPDMEADFGTRISDIGVVGILKVCWVHGRVRVGAWACGCAGMDAGMDG